jgi:hypothetical protein
MGGACTKTCSKPKKSKSISVKTNQESTSLTNEGMEIKKKYDLEFVTKKNLNLNNFWNVYYEMELDNVF